MQNHLFSSLRKWLGQFGTTSELSSLATQYGTDKLAHGYIEHYEHHFAPLRLRKLNILEIGVAEGASVNVWRRYFPNSTIHAIDIRDKHQFASEKVKIYQGDQNDREFLEQVSKKANGFDIVIDDGSHISEHVIGSFRTLFPLLNPEGIYVIEDLHTAYWTTYGGQWRNLNSGNTSMNLVKSLLDGLNCHWIPSREPDNFDQQIRAIHCYPKLAFIYKGENPVVHRPYDLKMMEESLKNAADD
jgi:hypothetical protein